MKARIIPIIAVATIFTTAGYVVGQTEDSSPMGRVVRSEFDLELTGAKVRLDTLRDQSNPENVKALNGAVDSYSTVMKEAARDPSLSQAAIQRSIYIYYLNNSSTRSAPQATQLAAEETYRLSILQAQQNQRIIELLEQLAKQKATK